MASFSRHARRLLTAACAGAAALGLVQTPAVAQLRPSERVDQAAGFAAEIRTLVPESPCAEIEVTTGEGGRLQLAGHVGLEEDRTSLVDAASAMVGEPVDGTAIDVLGADFCRIVEVLALYPESGMELAIPDHGEPPQLRDGEPLVLDLDVPQLAYLYLAFVQDDGRVGHMGLLPVKNWEGMERVRIETGFEIAPPYGREMVVAVASARPLFSEARPAFERADSFAPTLRAGLERVTAGGAAAEVDHLWLWTRP